MPDVGSSPYTDTAYHRLIREPDAEIEDIEAAIQSIMDEVHSRIITTPGIGYRMSAMILAEVGGSRFDCPRRGPYGALLCYTFLAIYFRPPPFAPGIDFYIWVLSCVFPKYCYDSFFLLYHKRQVK